MGMDLHPLQFLTWASQLDLPEDQMEIGIGIHGDPGRTCMPLKPADEIVKMLMEPILTDIP
jgi:dihydroxyacetone kinase-like protein